MWSKGQLEKSEDQTQLLFSVAVAQSNIDHQPALKPVSAYFTHFPNLKLLTYKSEDLYSL